MELIKYGAGKDVVGSESAKDFLSTTGLQPAVSLRGVGGKGRLFMRDCQMGAGSRESEVRSRACPPER
jgi:hypothetical protein